MAQAQSTSTAPVVTPITPAQPPVRPNRPRPGSSAYPYRNRLAPVILMNGYAISPSPSPSPKPKHAHAHAHARKTEGIQQDQFGTWSTSNH
jgi:hypothetical protein